MSVVAGSDLAVKACKKLWSYFNTSEWDEARKLLTDDFEAFWPQSREHITSPENFIEINRRYPGEHRIELQGAICESNSETKGYLITTHVYIESKMPDGKEMKLFATSFFGLTQDRLIKSATEYWADTYEAPEWRRDLVRKF